MINKIHKYFIYIFVINLFVVSSALFIEYILKVKPCALCIYQRYPYYLILLLSALFFLKNNWKYSLMILMTLTSIVGFFLAGYHVGIEYGVIDELSSCKTEISKNISKDILLKELQSKLAPSCKQVDFKLFGMSLALINMIMSLIFAILYYKMFSWIKKTSK
ncbi:disulfide bond formation protein B [Candidatus Pelagibacterales bacterium]|nr:disulfide bond formation protein B [Candidatus Fonsibacter sp.]GDX36923.1 disulfide bond formation protein B [Pelagibacterales bacterium]